METLERLKRKIDTATDLGSIVTTMKTLAVVSVHQYEEAVRALREFSRTIELGFQIVLREGLISRETETAKDPAGRTVAIVFGSDQGMCGQFNEEITSLFLEEHNRKSLHKGADDPSWLVVVVGHRAVGRLMDAGWLIERTYDTPTSVSDVTNLVLEILPTIEHMRRVDNVSRLLVFYNRRESASSFLPHIVQLLPLDPKRLREWQERPWDSRSLPSYASDRRQLLSQLVGQSLFISLFQACVESLASENVSRIVAMQAAEKNIQEQLELLRGSFNQQRQSAITEELLDVVNGFLALESQKS